MQSEAANNFIEVIWSNEVIYNDNVLDIKTLYSGLLQEKVIDKICLNKNRTFSIPDIPEEIKDCVVDIDLRTNSLLRTIQFTIVNPQNKEETTLVKALFKGEQCQVPSNEQTNGTDVLDENSQLSETHLAIIISSGGFIYHHLLAPTGALVVSPLPLFHITSSCSSKSVYNLLTLLKHLERLSLYV